MRELLHEIGGLIGLDTADQKHAPSVMDFAKTAWLSLLLLGIRLACERVFIPLLRRVLRPELRKKAADIFDDAFIATFAGAMEVHAIYTVLFFNFGCQPWATDACLLGWPEHSVNIVQRLYFVFSFQYYLYEMVGTALGCGTVLKTDMIIHHIATMGLITLGYKTNLLRYGTMWMALFDLSNPLLHLAKVMHAGQVPVLKDVMLPVFALVFFVCRLVAPPYSILYPALTKSIHILPAVYASIFIGLMIFVCVLQVFWFYKIVQIARRGNKPSDKDKGAAKQD